MNKTTKRVTTGIWSQDWHLKSGLSTMEIFRRFTNARWFMLIIVWEFVGVLHAAEDPRDSDSPCGVLEFLEWNHDWNNHFYDTAQKIQRSVTLMKEAGIQFVRMDFLWADLEPERGRFDFRHQDEIVNILSQQGIRILGVLQRTFRTSRNNIFELSPVFR